jgi:hypothetical protein
MSENQIDPALRWHDPASQMSDFDVFSESDAAALVFKFNGRLLARSPSRDTSFHIRIGRRTGAAAGSKTPSFDEAATPALKSPGKGN